MRPARALVGPTFIAAGLLHFSHTRHYVRTMPSYLPAHRELVLASGAAEVAGGLGMLHPGTRRVAGWLLIATLVGVFPANVHMARHPERFPVPGGRRALLARLPVQALFIAWVRSAMAR